MKMIHKFPSPGNGAVTSIYNEILHSLNILLSEYNWQAAAVIQIIQPIPIKNFGILHSVALEFFHVATMFVMLITWELNVKISL
jgi:hypothetical protein